MLQFAFLWLLREEADHGYRLRQRFERLMGGGWPLNTGQVYQSLRRMELLGLIHEVEVVRQLSGAPPRRIVAITPKGIRALERWMRRRPEGPRPVHYESLLRVLLLEREHPADAIALLEDQQACSRKAREVLLVRQGLPKRGGGPGRLMAIAARIEQTEAHLRWLEGCQRVLEQAVAGARQSA